MIRKSMVLILVLLFSVLNVFAGWTKTYGGNDWDWGYSVQQTTDGGYIIAGYTELNSPGNVDVYLIKTEVNGDTIWIRTYGGDSSDVGRSVQQTSDGGYIITGGTHSFGSGSSDVYLIKTHGNGDTIWTRFYGGTQFDQGYSVQQTSDGGYIITGETFSYGSGNTDVYLVKTDNNGDTVWARTFGGTDFDRGYSVQQTTDGGYIITGVYNEYSGVVYLIKTNSNGDSLWTRTFDGIGRAEGYSVQQTTDGGYIIVGNTSSYVLDGVYLIKTNSNGDSLWTKTYDCSSIDTLSCSGYSVQQTTDGGYIITGNCYPVGAYATDVCLIKTSSNGDSLWARNFGGTSSDNGYSVKQTTDGGYIIVGMTGSYGAGAYDVWLIKTDENGVAVEETIISIPERFSYSINQISNKNISLQFSLPHSDKVELNIFDAAGRYILTPISGSYSAGVNRVNIRIENSGIYFFNLKSDSQIEHGKFIIF